MPEPNLRIRMKKKADGSSVLSCVRSDGTVTWQRQEGRQGRFFPLHDLTHYAVEAVLGHRRGFFGLVAEGWDLGDFGSPWPRGPLPADLDPSEAMVGLLDLERAEGREWTATEMSQHLEARAREAARPRPAPVGEGELQTIRALRSELFARWSALASGEEIELGFPADAAPDGALA